MNSLNQLSSSLHKVSPFPISLSVSNFFRSYLATISWACRLQATVPILAVVHQPLSRAPPTATMALIYPQSNLNKRQRSRSTPGEQWEWRTSSGAAAQGRGLPTVRFQHRSVIPLKYVAVFRCEELFSTHSYYHAPLARRVGRASNSSRPGSRLREPITRYGDDEVCSSATIGSSGPSQGPVRPCALVMQ